MTLADFGGRDVERAKNAGATKEHRAVLLWMWQQICRHLGADTHPRDITIEVAQAYEGARREEHAKGQTITRELQALRRALRDAENLGTILAAPRRWPRVKRDPADTKRKDKLHPPHILHAWLGELSGSARDEAYLALTTGLRASELKRITWAWVRAYGDGHVLVLPGDSTKSRRERVVALTPEAYAILKRLAEHRTPPTPLLCAANHKTAYRLASKRIGYGRITLRDLRHTFGTWAAQAAGVEVARDALGHTDLAVTSRYVSSELSGLTAAALAIAGNVGTAKSAQSPGRAYMVGAAGFELATPSSQSKLLALYRLAQALSGGVDEAIDVLRRHMSAQQVGTGGRAQVTTRRGGGAS